MTKTTRITKTTKRHITRPALFAGLLSISILTLFMASCGDDDNPVTSTPVEGTFKQVLAVGSITTWEKIWGDPVNGVGPFLVGEDALVYKYNGGGWDSLNSGVRFDKFMNSVWGSSPNNVFFAGYIDNGITYTYPDTLDDGRDTTYTVTVDGPILTRYNGVKFIDFNPAIRWGLYDIWGASPDTVFAVGYDGSLLQYNGTSWTIVTTGGDNPVWLNSVWGTSSDNVYASGSHGALLHYDGSTWNIIATKTGRDLWDVWGLSDSSIYLVGSAGTIIHYDGTDFTPMATGVEKPLYSIWGTDENNLYAAGWTGTILHYDGVAWTEMTGVTDYGFLSVWGTGPNDIYFVGQTAFHYNGAVFEPLRVHHEPDFTDVWAGINSDNGIKEVIAVGTEGTILKSTGGDVFSRMSIDTGAVITDLYGVAGVSDSGLFIVGSGGTILTRNAASWQESFSGVPNDLFAVSALSKQTAYAVGAGGIVLSYNGTDWAQEAVGLTTDDLYDVWVGEIGSDTIVHVVGDNGATLYYDGASWQSLTPITGTPLYSVVGISTGQAYAVTVNGGVMRFDTPANLWDFPNITGSTEFLKAVWADGSDNIFIAAENGRVFMLEGSSLKEIETGIELDLSGLYGFSSTDFFVVGEFNHILHYQR